MLFDSLKDEVKVVKCENDELRKSLEYTQSELQDMRKCLEEQRGMTTHRSSHGEADENFLSERSSAVSRGLFQTSKCDSRWPQ